MFLRARTGIGLCAALLGYNTGIAETAIGEPTIIDGQTIKIEGRKHRLQGIEAPGRYDRCERGEGDWDCGKSARDSLSGIVRSRPVRCDTTKEDDFGNFESVCFVGKRELNAEMVAQGFARATDDRYAELEAHAKALASGFWARGPEWSWDDMRAGEASTKSGETTDAQ